MRLRGELAILCLMLGLLGYFVPATVAQASEQSDYEEADAAAQAATEACDAALEVQEQAQRARETIQTEVKDKKRELMKSREASADAAVALYKGNGSFNAIDAILSSSSLSEAFVNLDAYSRIYDWQCAELQNVTNAKAELDQALQAAQEAEQQAIAAYEEASNAKEEANAKRDEARAAYEAAQQAAASRVLSSSSSGAYAATSSSWNDEQSAKEYIIYRESRGNYSATNGRYYGAYQLDSSYLGGDYSPENQDRVAEEYVMGRYGSWSNAATFWDSHNWY